MKPPCKVGRSLALSICVPSIAQASAGRGLHLADPTLELLGETPDLPRLRGQWKGSMRRRLHQTHRVHRSGTSFGGSDPGTAGRSHRSACAAHAMKGWRASPPPSAMLTSLYYLQIPARRQIPLLCPMASGPGRHPPPCMPPTLTSSSALRTIWTKISNRWIPLASRTSRTPRRTAQPLPRLWPRPIHRRPWLPRHFPGPQVWQTAGIRTTVDE